MKVIRKIVQKEGYTSVFIIPNQFIFSYFKDCKKASCELSTIQQLQATSNYVRFAKINLALATAGS